MFYENKSATGNWQIIPYAGQLWMDNGSGSSPSIDEEPNISYLGNTVVIVWQEAGYIQCRAYSYNTTNNDYELSVNWTWVSGEPAGAVLAPSVALSYNGWCIVAWERSSSGGLRYRIEQLGNPNTPIYEGPISGTNSNSSNPSASATKNSNYFDIAWQQLTPPPPGPPPVSIVACRLGQTGTVVHAPTAISSSAMKINSHVSIASLPTDAKVCWIADFSGTGDPGSTSAIFCSPWTSLSYWRYYYYCKSTSINKLDDESNFYFAFSQIFNMQGYNDYDWVVSGSNLNTWRNVNTNKTDVQLCNGPTNNNMFLTSYYSSTLPYYFQMSNSLGSAGLGKENTNSIISGRGVVLENNGAGIYYSLSRITVDGNPVNFIQMNEAVGHSNNDSLYRSVITEANGKINATVDTVNKVMVSDPFTIAENSKLTFDEYSGVADSASAASLLAEKRNVTFTISLVDDATGQTIGTLKEAKFIGAALSAYKTSSYIVDTKDIQGKMVRIKVTVFTNVDNPKLTLINKYTGTNGANQLNKSTTVQELTFEALGVVKDYALDQNYPNPFNPATTISYQIPKDGRVTIKIYDIVGREVATLVDEARSAGQYAVKFDASHLSSGIYFYSIKSGDYTAVKKMSLIK